VNSQPGDAPSQHDARAWQHVLAILAGTTILRLALGAFVPLFPDEAYYWDWSRTLQPGYFDHPPIIAVLVRAGTAIFGDTPLGVRFFPILAGTGAAAGLAFASRALAGAAAARTAVLVFACLPLAAAGFVLATPDAPMLCGVAWAIYAVIRALESPLESRDALRWWSLAGLCIGLAMASKYTAVLLPAAIAVACVAHPRLQNQYGEKGPYLAVVIASLVLAPVLGWNARHDWVSFQFQLGHGLGVPKGGALGAVNREVELIGGQIGLVSPVLFFFVLRAIRRAFAPTPDGLRFVLAVASSICVAFFLYSATRRSVEANWPALAWLPAVVLLATEPAMPWREHRWLNRGLALGAALSGVVYLHVLFPVLPLPAPRDQVAKAFGWDAVGAAIDRRSAWITSRASFGGTLYVAAERYQDAAEIAFHVRGHPRVFAFNLVGRPNQYDLWRTFPERATSGSTLLLVLDDEAQEPRVIRKLSCCFHIDQGESVALMRRDQLVTRKRLWLLSNWNGEWPRRDQPFPWTD
jgi:4-amino-4-deoxy-L-arabinose transferase-like glycosyltransferase